MPTLNPFRSYDEKDVINLFAFDGTLPATKGTLVKVSTGWKSSDELEMLGSVGASFGNTVSQRYGVTAKVAVAGATDAPLGMLLFDVKETDENGELLKFNPRKAAEMEAVLSGQSVPIVTKGIFLYSGATLASDAPTAGAALYCGAAGEITTTAGSNVRVGTALGAKDSNNGVLIKLDL